MSQRRRPRWPWVLALVVVVPLAIITMRYFFFDMNETPPPKPPTVASDEAVIRDVVILPTGTIIPDQGPPKGWSHLVIKSKPRLDDADRSKVSSIQAHLVGLIFTVNVADVGVDMTDSGKKDYYLGKLALGLGANIDGQDTTMLPEDMTRERSRELNATLLGINLGRILVDEIHKHQQEGRLVAATRRTALLDTPVFAQRPTGHRKMIVRHLHLVEPLSGELTVATWLIDLNDDGDYVEAVGPVEVLPPNKVSDAVMRVDTNEINALGMPSERAFAVVTGPQGEWDFPLPEKVISIAGQARLSLEEYRELVHVLADRINGPHQTKLHNIE